MDKRAQTACFTGHRIIRAKDTSLQSDLRVYLIDLIGRGFQFFEAGGAKGFDLLASEAVLDLRKDYPEISLTLVLPFVDQFTQEHWKADEIERFKLLRDSAQEIVHLQEAYSRGCYYRRNRRLVDDSSVCLCYQYKNTGGTAYTTRYAISKGLEVINCY